jgi:hypothetical protein
MRTTFVMLATMGVLLGGVAFGEEQDGGAAAVTCAGDRDCDDGNSRTHDFCERSVNGQEQAEPRCVHVLVRAECTGNEDCDDQDPATRDTCLRGVGEHGEPEARCLHEASASGCLVNSDCDDSNPDTRDTCQHIFIGERSEARCLHDAAVGGCRSDQECDDADPCTHDRCVHGVNENGEPRSSCDHAPDDECTKRAMSDPVVDQR